MNTVRPRSSCSASRSRGVTPMIPGRFERAHPLRARRGLKPTAFASATLGSRPSRCSSVEDARRRWRPASSCRLVFLERQQRCVAARRGRVDRQRALAHEARRVVAAVAAADHRNERPICAARRERNAATVRRRRRRTARRRAPPQADPQPRRIGRRARRSTRLAAARVGQQRPCCRVGSPAPCARSAASVAAMHATRPRGSSVERVRLAGRDRAAQRRRAKARRAAGVSRTSRHR